MVQTKGCNRLRLILVILTLFGAQLFLVQEASAAVALSQSVYQYGGTVDPVNPTLVLDSVDAANTAGSSLPTIVRQGTVVYAIATNPADLSGAAECPVSADVPAAVLSFVRMNPDGTFSLGAVEAGDDTIDLAACLDRVTTSLNTSTDQSTPSLDHTSSVFDVSDGYESEMRGMSLLVEPYYLSGGDFQWWGASDHGWMHLHLWGWNLRNDGLHNPERDYWVAECLQEVEPGCSLYGNNWRTDDVLSKYSLDGDAMSIEDCKPLDSQPRVGGISFNVGLPPSVTFEYFIDSVYVDNQSQPANGFARWVHDYDWTYSDATGYHYTRPGFAEIVPQNAQFACYVSLTNVWVNVIWPDIPIGSFTARWNGFSITLDKP